MDDGHPSIRSILPEELWCSDFYRLIDKIDNVYAIALFTVNFSHFHYNVFEHGCEAISGNFALLARNCLTSTFKNIVMQMRKVNCEKGYCPKSPPIHVQIHCNANEKTQM